ncbi:MAG: hypothetical protein NW216_08720 [Hyphomicrobium sp.]|nr:hypothetical protein [Hyphomicrobium sp.]
MPEIVASGPIGFLGSQEMSRWREQMAGHARSGGVVSRLKRGIGVEGKAKFKRETLMLDAKRDRPADFTSRLRKRSLKQQERRIGQRVAGTNGDDDAIFRVSPQQAAEIPAANEDFRLPIPHMYSA